MTHVFSWLRFDLTQIQKDFHIKREGQGKNKKFFLIPKEKKSHFKKIQLSMNDDYEIDSIVMTDKEMDTISIQFTEIKSTR